jgi:uncharacterized protein (TIGR01777 family)
VKVAVTGSNGLIGFALVTSLVGDGHEVRRLVRRTPSAPGEVRWDPAARTIDLDGLAGVDAVVHLAGAGVGDKRWTTTYKQEIRNSRVDGTATIAKAIAALDPKPRVLLAGSAIGYYGDTGDHEVDESAPNGDGFFAEVVRDWEKAARPAQDAGVRTVHLRTGVVMADTGGSLGGKVSALGVPVSVLGLFKAGIGGPLGSGKQWVSWISLTDQIAAMRFLLDDDAVSGPVNLTAPRPVRNKEWVRAIGHALHRPAVVPVPAFALRGVIGEFADEGPLVSQKVLPRRLEQAGFTFTHTDIDSALAVELG